MATDVEAEILHGGPRPPLSQPVAREESWISAQNVRQIRRGLAAQPVAGMESVFEHWLQLPNDFEGDAIQGLRMLNTKESRAALAELASAPDKPNNYTQEGAAYALAEMGDRQYYPLMVQLLASANQRVRRAAIKGVGALGGDAGVTKLAEIARTGNEIEQGDAMTALGDSDSRAAVKALINLMAEKDLKHPLDAQWPLFELTHHHLPHLQSLRTPEQAHAEWQQWWDAGGNKAPIYSQYECAPKGDLP